MVGLGRLELPTSPLSGARSSHLSYRPTKRRDSGKDFIIYWGKVPNAPTLLMIPVRQRG
jgi:hypothetical protein